MRGRKPKPTALKILEGDLYTINRNEPIIPPGSLEPPGWLAPVAKYKWEELAPILSRAGLLTEGDRDALAMLCDEFARILRDPENAKARDRYRRMLVEFGLTPSSRSRLKSTVEKPKDRLEEFLAG